METGILGLPRPAERRIRTAPRWACGLPWWALERAAQSILAQLEAGTRATERHWFLDPFSPLGQFPNPAPSRPGVPLAAAAEATATTTRRPDSATTCAIRRLRGARLSSSDRSRGRALLVASSSDLGRGRVSSERRWKEPARRAVPCVHSAIRHLRWGPAQPCLPPQRHPPSSATQARRPSPFGCLYFPVAVRPHR